jgi:hypothetical protein
MFKVKKECCGQCLFSKDKIVSSERKRDILSDCRQNDSHFICHKASINGEDICCKGSYDTQTSNMMRISQRMGMVEFAE